MKLYLENIRSFAGWHEIPIGPATVLLGENSAGKSTLLGMLAAVLNPGFPFRGNLFNTPPFEFGGFKTLAHHAKGVPHFSVGFEMLGGAERYPLSRSRKKSEPTGCIAAFRDHNGLPVVCHFLAWWGNECLVAYEKEFADTHQSNPKLHAIVQGKTLISIEVSNHPNGLQGENIWLTYMQRMDRKKTDFSDFDLHLILIGDWRWPGQSALAFAPMRSRPKRTYDQLSDEFSPEGEHVPSLLARAVDTRNKDAAALHQAVQNFGKYSGMFSDISVKQLGKGSGDPFQVQVNRGRKKVNLMDVGYGVSQVLPLIIGALHTSPKTMLLLQQPEVHLHPRAQAALGSMIKDWVTQNKKTVVVETHSDYLFDRLRLEVKNDALTETDLKVYFLDWKNGQTLLHALRIDNQGNVLDAPNGYRDFFLREQKALLID